MFNYNFWIGWTKNFMWNFLEWRMGLIVLQDFVWTLSYVFSMCCVCLLHVCSLCPLCVVLFVESMSFVKLSWGSMRWVLVVSFVVATPWKDLFSFCIWFLCHMCFNCIFCLVSFALCFKLLFYLAFHVFLILCLVSFL
jgi:hypothetical protein